MVWLGGKKDIRATMEIRLHRKQAIGWLTLIWQGTVRIDLKAWQMQEEWAQKRKWWTIFY